MQSENENEFNKFLKSLRNEFDRFLEELKEKLKEN